MADNLLPEDDLSASDAVFHDRLERFVKGQASKQLNGDRADAFGWSEFVEPVLQLVADYLEAEPDMDFPISPVRSMIRPDQGGDLKVVTSIAYSDKVHSNHTYDFHAAVGLEWDGPLDLTALSKGKVLDILGLIESECKRIRERLAESENNA
ncbi:MAG: hypothetical protein CMK96_03460 [Pseudomonas sp.]|jgi:hypothetical protein|nr:hypothetical protein [Pseudomonas sp.]|tara:strand:- start:33 stop:488 length:456 start_codon:yes stop_codon:yes gene_type:complete